MKKTTIYAGVFGAFLLAQGAYADNDSSADLNGGFVSTLSDAPGLVLRVEIDASGRENTGSTEMRVVTSQVSDAAQLETAFARGTDTSTQPQITKDDIAADSSTFGFFPIRFNFGWSRPYYYQTYYPTYYYGGYYYNYGRPYYYYNNWNNYHRYYYYPRYY